MNSVDALLSFAMRHSQTIVFGNLAQFPQVVFAALEAVPMLQVSVVSKHDVFPASVDHRIRVVDKTDEPCDLLVVIEPTPRVILVKPPTASRMLVVTSHLAFETGREDVFAHVCYFHNPGGLLRLARHTAILSSMQDASIQTTNVAAIDVGAVNVTDVKGRSERVLDVPTYVVIDLSLHPTSGFGMYLAFMNAFRFMLDNAEAVSGWLVSFPGKNGRRAFEQFVQETLDKLYCLRFESGNVTDVQKILPLLPFYRSGTVDRTFDVETFDFLGVECVAPQTARDVCEAVAMHDLTHWVGPIYRR